MNDINQTLERGIPRGLTEPDQTQELLPRSVLEQILVNSVDTEHLPRMKFAALETYRAVTQGKESDAKLIAGAWVSGYIAAHRASLQIDEESMLTREQRLLDLSTRVEEIDDFGSLLKLSPDLVQEIIKPLAKKRTPQHRTKTYTSLIKFVDEVDDEWALIKRRLRDVISNRHFGKQNRKYKNPHQSAQALTGLAQEVGIPLEIDLSIKQNQTGDIVEEAADGYEKLVESQLRDIQVKALKQAVPGIINRDSPEIRMAIKSGYEKITDTLAEMGIAYDTFDRYFYDNGIMVTGADELLPAVVDWVRLQQGVRNLEVVVMDLKSGLTERIGDLLQREAKFKEVFIQGKPLPDSVAGIFHPLARVINLWLNQDGKPIEQFSILEVLRDANLRNLIHPNTTFEAILAGEQITSGVFSVLSKRYELQGVSETEIKADFYALMSESMRKKQPVKPGLPKKIAEADQKTKDLFLMITNHVGDQDAKILINELSQIKQVNLRDWHVYVPAYRRAYQTLITNKKFSDEVLAGRVDPTDNRLRLAAGICLGPFKLIPAVIHLEHSRAGFDNAVHNLRITMPDSRKEEVIYLAIIQAAVNHLKSG